MSKPLDDHANYGLSVIGGMMGSAFEDALRTAATSDAFGSPIARMAVDYAFADAWGREGLQRRERSLVVLGALIGLHQPQELKNHVKIAIANGITMREIEEVLIQACPYVGFPAISSALTAAIEALREIGQDPHAKTSAEAGLL